MGDRLIFGRKQFDLELDSYKLSINKHAKILAAANPGLLKRKGKDWQVGDLLDAAQKALAAAAVTGEFACKTSRVTVH